MVDFVMIRIRTFAEIGHQYAGFVKVHTVEVRRKSGSYRLLSKNAFQKLVRGIVFLVGVIVVESGATFWLRTQSWLSCLVIVRIVLRGNYSVVYSPQV